jgi:hypothetical protein
VILANVARTALFPATVDGERLSYRKREITVSMSGNRQKADELGGRAVGRMLTDAVEKLV